VRYQFDVRFVAVHEANARHIHEVCNSGELDVIEGGHKQGVGRGVSNKIAYGHRAVDLFDVLACESARDCKSGFDGMCKLFDIHGGFNLESASLMPIVKVISMNPQTIETGVTLMLNIYNV